MLDTLHTLPNLSCRVTMKHHLTNQKTVAQNYHDSAIPLLSTDTQK